MDRLQQAGVAALAVGAVATVVTLLPLLTGAEPMPLGWYLASMLAPLGLGLLLVSLWRTARARGRRTREQHPG